MSEPRPITFENHDAYLLYQAISNRLTPEIHVHGEVSVKYALSLYYRFFPDERPRNYKRKISA